MKLKCPKCKKIKNYDMRNRDNKESMTKRGFPSVCIKFGKNVFMKPIK